jgi:hypothetical protein
MTPLCPVCVEPMTKHGRAFQRERCRQIIVFFEISDASRYITNRTEPEPPKKERSCQAHCLDGRRSVSIADSA